MLKQIITGIAAVATLSLVSPAQAQWFDGSYFSGLVGLQLNLVGRDLNGATWNGEQLDGRRLAFVEKAGAVDKKGDEFDVVKEVGSLLVGQTAMGTFRAPKQMKKSVFMGRLTDGGVLPLRINKIKRDAAEHHKDVYHYIVSFQTDNGWQPLCGRDENGRKIGAVVLSGRWDMSEGTESGGAHFDDDDVFTFACDGGVLAHCVDAGYKPWRRAQQCNGEDCRVVNLADHHQACTRMLRGDFCGDGTAHTEDNVAINHYDGFGIRSDSEDWTFEAEWTADGATCMNEQRLPTHTPACAADLVREDCGAPDHLVADALLFSEH
jgi:hypothetical protein